MGNQAGVSKPGCFTCFSRKPKKPQPQPGNIEADDKDIWEPAASEDSFYSLETRSQLSSSSADLHAVRAAIFDDSDPSSLAVLVSARLDRDDISISELSSILALSRQPGQRARAASELHALCRRHGLALGDVAPAFLGVQPDMAPLLQVAQDVQEALADLHSGQGWQLVVNSSLKMFHRQVQQSEVHSFKAVCTLEAQLEQPLALFREFDLVNSWAHMVSESLLLQEASLHEALVYAALWVPWPFTPPELLIQATFLDLLDSEGCFLISLRSPKELPQGVALPPDSHKRERLDVLPGSCVKLVPVKPAPAVAAKGSQQVFSEVQIHVDARGRSVPAFVVQFVLKVLAPFLYKQVLKVLRKSFQSPGDVVPQRMARRAELYDAIRACVQEHLAAGTGTVRYGAVDSGGDAAAGRKR